MPQTTKALESTLVFQAIPAEYLHHVRSSGRDEAGNTVTARTVTEGGSPLRCCLRDSRPGERLLLIAYTPPGTAGPYAERGPVFVHAEPCTGYADIGAYPAGLAHRRQVVRAYDRQGNMGDGALVDDGEPARTVIAELLARPDVAIVHARNVVAGCYNFCVIATGPADR
jgi:hypothetical protein